jgi:acetylornithine/succinyldiaminopimelate/putrescine aminotransferase/predicted amino acid dehydrogenase
VLDVTGGYGCNLLGHSNPDLIDHITHFLKSQGIAISDQLSNQYYPAKLAQKLNDQISRITGQNYVVLFGSTGSEVVEIAIMHAYREWKKKLQDLYDKQRRYFAEESGALLEEVWAHNWRLINGITNSILVNKMAYHGNTLGAKALLGDFERRNMFKPLYGIESIFIDDTIEGLEDLLQQTIQEQNFEIQVFSKKEGKLTLEPFKVSKIIAAILEPILGEGGIRCIDPIFPELLEYYGFPIVFDEIQSGLGRSGNFLASHKNKGHYYLFSKALGGNICKISAVAIQKDRFVEEFGKDHISTFSGGGLAASVALKTLSLLEELNVNEKSKVIGDQLIETLQQIQEKFPEIITDITGTGLMVGIKFQAPEQDAILGILSTKKVLGYVLSSYLLHNFNIRILPSISAPNLLRVEPSICFGKMEIQMLCNGIESVANLLYHQKVYELTKHLMDGDGFTDNKGLIPDFGFFSGIQEVPAPEAKKVAFIGHFTQPCMELRMLSKSLCQASDTGLLKLFHRLVGMLNMEPLVLNSTNLYHGKIHLTILLVPVDSGMLEKMNRTEKRKDIIKNIQKAVNLAGEMGIEYVSLGGYNSIITRDGLAVTSSKNMEVLTGNTLTAVVGYHNFVSKIRSVFGEDKGLKIAVVGATGNIGKIICERLIHEESITVSSMTIIAKNQKRMEDLNSHLNLINVERTITIDASRDLKSLKSCDAVIIAVNTNDAIIHRSFLKDSGDVVLVDVSVPTALGEDLLRQPNIHFQHFAASVCLKDDPEVLITSCSPRGTALCCVAESLLCGLQGIKTPLKGEITYESFKIIEEHAMGKGLLEVLNQSKSFKSARK